MSYTAFFNAESYFDIVTEVTESWDKIKNSSHDYKVLVGVTLFLNMYEVADKAVDAAGAQEEWKGYPFNTEDVEKKSERFLSFVKTWVRMMDMTVNMLGPDLDILEEQLLSLGAVHEKFNVLPHHYDLMGKALLQTFEEVLGDEFTPDAKNAWKSLYGFMAETMMEGEANEW